MGAAAAERKSVEAQEKQKSRFTWVSLIIAIVVIAVCTSVIMKYLSQARAANDGLIADEIVQLQKIFKRINDSCKITGFRHKKDHIDFLNVISFAGTVVGPMNLLEPENWEGPYVDESITMNGKEYQIVATKTGFYIVPGDGVKLSNGQILGKTLIIGPRSNIEQMMRDPQALLSNNRALAARIDTYHNPFASLAKSDFIDEAEEYTK